MTASGSTTNRSHLRFAGVFFLLAVGLAGAAVQVPRWGWCPAWIILAFLWVAITYLLRRPTWLGKRSDGTLRMGACLVLFPYFLMTWTVWHSWRRMTSEAASHRFDDLLLGRRPLRGEVPEDVRSIVDLTSEFAAVSEVRSQPGYNAIPLLDATMPRGERFEELVVFVRELPRPVFVHCAQGHGRSATIVAAILVLEGRAESSMEAERLLRSERPGVKVNHASISSLTPPLDSV